MVLAVKVPKKKAEEVKRELEKRGLLNTEYRAIKQGEFVFFPVKDAVEGLETVEVDLPPTKKKPRSLEEALKGVLSEEEMKTLVKSFDIVGHVAVIEIPEELRNKEKIIAEAIMKVHPNVKTVAVEEGPTSGPYRVQPVRVVLGERNLLTLYREHGVEMWVEVGSVYFSVRHSFERKRIAEQVKPGEIVAALFAGVGPYPLVIAKKQPLVKKIYAVELNPRAYELMVKNVEHNRLEKKIIPILGDVRDVVPRMFPRMADRVIMPLPKSAEDFLDVAMEALKPQGGIIHLYTFGPAEDPYSHAEKRIKEVANEWGYDVEFLAERKVADYAPRIWKVVIDARVFPRSPE